MDKIRVLLGNHPIMLPDTVRTWIGQQEDMEVVSDCRGPMRILQEAGRTNADIAILTQEGNQQPNICKQLLDIYPDLTILCLALKAEKVYTQRLRACRKAVRIPQRQSLTHVLRTLIFNHRENRGDSRLCGRRIKQEDDQ